MASEVILVIARDSKQFDYFVKKHPKGQYQRIMYIHDIVGVPLGTKCIVLSSADIPFEWYNEMIRRELIIERKDKEFARSHAFFQKVKNNCSIHCFACGSYNSSSLTCRRYYEDENMRSL
jgi:hypothetical protein